MNKIKELTNTFELTRTMAIRQLPYFAMGLYRLKPVPNREGVEGVERMAVDQYWRVYYNPKWISDSPLEETATHLLCCFLQCLNNHSGRRENMGADKIELWGLASVVSITDVLLNTSLCYIPEQWPTRGLLELEKDETVEGCYNELLEKGWEEVPANMPQVGSAADGQQKEWEDGPPSPDKPGLSPGQIDITRKQVAKKIESQNNRNPGSVPMGLLRWAQDILEPAVDYKRVLSDRVRHGIQATQGYNCYTYKKPPRKRIPGVIMPSAFDRIPKVAVVADTSGSMGEKELARVMAEVKGVLASIRAEFLYLSCDAAVHTVKKIMRVEQVELTGGGGTDMGVGIEAAVEHKFRPQVIIVITDGYTPWPAEEPKQKVIAVITEGGCTGQAPAWVEEIPVEVKR